MQAKVWSTWAAVEGMKNWSCKFLTREIIELVVSYVETQVFREEVLRIRSHGVESFFWEISFVITRIN